MTDTEIKKALECCSTANCDICPNLFVGGNDVIDCRSEMLTTALDLINRQQEEIERLQKRLSIAEDCILEVDDALYRGSTNDYAEEAIAKYNNLVKEMVGDAE